jgi:hypothetical protein
VEFLFSQGAGLVLIWGLLDWIGFEYDTILSYHILYELRRKEIILLMLCLCNLALDCSLDLTYANNLLVS